MKWTNDHGSHYLEGERWLLQPIEEWSQFWQRCNWYTIHPINLELENDESMGGIEVTVIILGIGLRWRWNHSETEMSQRIARQVADIEAGRVETVPFKDS